MFPQNSAVKFSRDAYLSWILPDRSPVGTNWVTPPIFLGFLEVLAICGSEIIVISVKFTMVIQLYMDIAC